MSSAVSQVDHSLLPLRVHIYLLYVIAQDIFSPQNNFGPPPIEIQPILQTPIQIPSPESLLQWPPATSLPLSSLLNAGPLFLSILIFCFFKSDRHMWFFPLTRLWHYWGQTPFAQSLYSKNPWHSNLMQILVRFPCKNKINVLVGTWLWIW